MGIDGPRERLRRIVLAEQALYLDSLAEDSFSKTSLLDRMHQAVFRMLAKTYGERAFPIQEAYFLRPDLRFGITRELSEALWKGDSSRDSILDELGLDGKAHYSTCKNALSDAAHAVLGGISGNGSVKMANRFGFALFDALSLQDGGKTVLISDNEYCSVGAGLYYAFTFQGDPRIFMQSESIQSIATALYLYLKHRDHVETNGLWIESKIIRELEAAFGAPDLTAIARSVTRMFYEHELGHRFELPGSSKFLALMERIGIPIESLYKGDFATADQLNAWARMKKDEAGVSDVSFLLGDFIANLGIIMGPADPKVLSTLNAFNWGLAVPPHPKRRPRGRVSLLHYARGGDEESLLRHLEGIFESARSGGPTLDMIYRMEHESWGHLASDLGMRYVHSSTSSFKSI